MPEPQIKVEGTPNPNAAKFTVDRVLSEQGSRSYFDASDATGDPLASRLFEIGGVRALLIAEDFITVTKTEETEWSELLDPIREAIRSRVSA